MSSFLHQRPLQSPLSYFREPSSPRSSALAQKHSSIFGRAGLLVLLVVLVVLGVFMPWSEMHEGIFSSTRPALTKWRGYTLAQAASFVGKNGTVIVCAVSQPYLPFLNNWLISIARQKHH